MGADHRVHLTGTITDLDFGCWADRDCRIEVGDAWIVTSSGGPRETPVVMGHVIGIAMAGGSADAVRAKYVGRAVEVFADALPIYDAAGNVTGYDARRLTLEGSAEYYVRAR
jgi:hypothetical protein